MKFQDSLMAFWFKSVNLSQVVKLAGARRAHRREYVLCVLRALQKGLWAISLYRIVIYYVCQGGMAQEHARVQSLSHAEIRVSFADQRNFYLSWEVHAFVPCLDLPEAKKAIYTSYIKH
jgi:hypothetical protein